MQRGVEGRDDGVADQAGKRVGTEVIHGDELHQVVFREPLGVVVTLDHAIGKCDQRVAWPEIYVDLVCIDCREVSQQTAACSERLDSAIGASKVRRWVSAA